MKFWLLASLDDLTPWYADFKNTFLSLRGITEYETFDHPVATMIVISSTNPDPVSTIMQLYNPNVPSFTIDKPYVDTNILRYYVVLHDSNLTTLEHSMAVFEKLKRTVGLHCFLLKINSKPRDPTDNDNIEDKSEDDIRAIWEEGLSEMYHIESMLHSYTANLSSTMSMVGVDPTDSSSTSISSTVSTPISVTPGHSRSVSVSSNRSSNNSSPLPPATVIQGTSIQSIPVDLLDEKSEDTLSSTLSPLLSETTTVQYGRCLRNEDINNVKTMIREFVIQSLIPFMERNIQHWNEQVASVRRGLTGRLFGASRRFFGSSTRSPALQSVQTISAQGPNVPFGVNTIMIYPASSPEAQMRKLADYAFMLRDYKFAYTIYDTVRRDYATEKTYAYHAGSQEMMGICLLMMSPLQTNKMDVDRHFELAIQQYLGRCRSPFHATRATIMYYELLKGRQMWKEIPTALVRMTGEDSDLRSGLFLEQAAHCFLRAHRPMVRKYGFHLVMAGHRYGKAGQRLHAYRAYQMAADVLEGHNWSLAQSHVQFALGRQAFHLGRLKDAVACFSNVLSDNVKQTAQQQAAHMREFLFIYQQYTEAVGLNPLKASLPHLFLPIIDDRDIQVTLSNAQPKTSQREEWAHMELALLEDSIKHGYISSSKRAMAVQQQDDHRIVCAVGEPAIVHIDLFNPLQISISLSHVMLGCQYQTSIDAQESKMDTSEEMPECKQKQDSNSDIFNFDYFSLQKLDEITLEPLEKKTINLKIVPHHEGSIQVTGLHYTLNELVHTFKPFSKKGKRLNRTKEEMMSATYAADRSLDILVTSPMPLLDLVFHHVPDSILSGEVIQTVLEINNKGNKGLTLLRLKTSHPSFVCVGDPEDMDKDIYAVDNSTPNEIEINNQLFDSSVVTIPLPAKEHSHEHGIVLPGETTLVPFWIRGDRIGTHTFKFLFSYQSNEDNVMIAHRTLRYTMHIQVLPSLKINAFTRPSTTTVNEYILGIEIENLQTVASFDLTQLLIASPSWSIYPLSIDMTSTEDILAKTMIPPRQTTFTFYKLRRKIDIQGNYSSPEAWTSEALGALLKTSDTKSQRSPPPIQLEISKLSFVRKNAIMLV
ncbi:ER-golgi trafficking TRAPP I complex 85 kDa subunit-domain-containing protein [Cokeromyces recurvatus]|uniref:ER-golgi trafficking TRAPP I complex 85 kDa subunit-domain-containing protein n=1 Tax=Cokeromyces recurvatus TaxID=90255 RepID=UPI00221FAA6D|nr:ER-golgi trafficking TRAPP I complex 85 kDa subunit-domain-containing protein [Cokeromyces recurvatus]KAI7902118.1 ER-golgi trafficking TRAPP I complex 85 kDa subunit-domain-containing protein [Cokeromyces recurvatus]